MSYIGISPSTAAFPYDQFSGNGTTTAFTMSYAPASTTSIIVSISGVVQNPNTYSVTGLTLNFSPAPPTGTNNIGVLYLGIPATSVTTPGNTAYLTTTSFTATAGQTTFTPSGSYQVGFINVIRNGSQLAPADFTATNGTTVVLNNACVAGDVVVTQGYTLSSIANALPSTGGTVTGATTFNSSVTINGGSASGYTGYKNRIINGGMTIDQRYGGAATANTISGYTVDRWAVYQTVTGKVIAQQNAGSVTPPVGFVNYLGVTSQSAYTVLTGDYYVIQQSIEGYNIADLAYGTASAATVTLSFWVRSSLTGTFGASVRALGATTRAYPFTYTISAANTWEQKTVVIPGDTAFTPYTNSNAGFNVSFGLGVGTTYSGSATGTWSTANSLSATGGTSVVGTNGATFYVTGVQLERGSNATSFEFRDYGRELIMCQRYYEKSYNVDVAPATNTVVGVVQAIIAAGSAAELDAQATSYRTTKRAAATVTTWTSSGTVNKYNVIGLGDYTPTIYASGMSGFTFYTTTSGLTQFQARLGYYHWAAESEL